MQTDLTSPDTNLDQAKSSILQEGDIVFARTGASVGKTYIYNKNDGLVYFAGFLIRVRVKPEYNVDFVFQNTLTKNYAMFINITSQRSGQPGVNAQEYASFTFLTPTLPEQARIGAFFRHLDRLVALHQCNCNMATRPCEWSSGLRAIAWEQRKLGDLAGFLPNNTFSRAELSENGRIQNIHYGDVLIKFGEVLDVANEQLPFVAKTKKINKISELKLENGDIVFADAAEDKTVGKCTELFNIIDKIVISGLHTIPCRPQIAFATAYLGYFFNSPCYRTQLLPLMQGIKVLSLSKTALLQTDIFYPKDQSEQARIGTFFRHLDRLITLHQRKHILLT